MQQAFHRVSEAMYERAQAQQQQQAAGANGSSTSGNGAGAEEEVVDAEVVDEQR